MFPHDIEATARRIVEAATRRGVWLSTAESCTGGLVGAALTAIPGSSAVYDRGFITYSNAAKSALLQVPQAMLEQYGAVSEPVARAMAEGALHASGADLAVSVTGIAGPGGATPDKPVGLVHFGLAGAGRTTIHRVKAFGAIGRDKVRSASLMTALDLLETSLAQLADGP